MTTLPAAVVRTEVPLPLHRGDDFRVDARAYTFDGLVDGGEHIALGLGCPPVDAPPLVRLHSECLTGDALGSERCDCGPQLDEAVRRIAHSGGYLLYLRQEGRGIGLYAKLDAYVLQDTGLDTYDANVALGFDPDDRTYAAAAQMLHALGVCEVDLLTNNPDKVAQLEASGVRVRQRVPTALHLSHANGRYLATKAERGGHELLYPPVS